MLKAEANKFQKYEAILAAKFPAAAAEARLLSDIVIDPIISDTETVWSVLWGKPLFANARVQVAERWCETLRPHMDSAWNLWGEPEHFLLTKTGSGIQRSSFSASGPAAEKILQTSIALHRVYAIQGAARAIKSRAQVSGYPFQNLAEIDLPEAVGQLRTEFGSGWGPITVLHFLTDLGLAVKPDLHLMRTMRHLSNFAEAGARKVPSLDEAIAVNLAVKKLAIDVGRDTSPASMRYFDKVLMEISRQGIV